MRIVICGDTHIGAVFGLGKPNGFGGNTRVDDYEKTLNYIIDYAIANNVDAFLQTGDAFETRMPSPEHMSILNNAIKRLSMANILTAIIMGNHDYRRAGSVFTSAISSLAAKDYPNVRIVLEPQILKLAKSNGDGVSIALLPYRERKMYSGKTTEEDSREYAKEVGKLLSCCTKDYPIVAVGHNFFLENSYNDYAGNEILAELDIFRNCDLVAMGHLHRFRIVRRKKPIAIYTGSMERLNFGDEDVNKYFIDYDTSEQHVNVLKIPSRDLRDLEINLEDCTPENIIEVLTSKISSLQIKDMIVRVKITLTDNLVPFIKRNQVEKMLYDQNAFFVSKIIVDSVFRKVVRNNNILQQKSDLAMFEEFVKDQDFEKELELGILTEAQKIIK